MSGIYGLVGFVFGTLFGLAVYHFCMKSAMKISYQIENNEMPFKDTGQIEQDYAE
jgi:hypothetical protein